MLAELLSSTQQKIEQFQNEYHVTYDCVDNELNCLKEHINLVIKYLDPLSENDLNISLPKTQEEVTRTVSVKILSNQ